MPVSEEMVERALKAAPQFWRDTRDCKKKIAKMLTAALSDKVVGWRPIETAPKDGTNFLAAQAGNGSANDTPWWVLFWNGDAFECVSSGKVIPTATKIVGGVTHWQPLPTPPQPSEDNGPDTNGGET